MAGRDHSLNGPLSSIPMHGGERLRISGVFRRGAVYGSNRTSVVGLSDVVQAESMSHEK